MQATDLWLLIKILLSQSLEPFALPPFAQCGSGQSEAIHCQQECGKHFVKLW